VSAQGNKCWSTRSVLSRKTKCWGEGKEREKKGEHPKSNTRKKRKEKTAGL